VVQKSNLQEAGKESTWAIKVKTLYCLSLWLAMSRRLSSGICSRYVGEEDWHMS